MNIFEIYLKKISSLVKKNQKELGLKEINDFIGVTVEIPPSKINSDFSTNISMILAKLNKLEPNNLALNIKSLLEKNVSDFKKIEVVRPGFINIYLSNDAFVKIINKIFDESSKYGSIKSNKSYNIEFVSANPTGPMHVGHCRRSDLWWRFIKPLKFNGNKVTKEYYINDYGNQIKNFLKSVYLRIREIKFKEKFSNEEDLYPGEYIKEIASKIINKSNYEFNTFEESYELLEKESLNHSMDMIKSDLKKLGIIHDNFVSEKSIVNSNIFKKAIDQLKKTKHVEEGYLDPPKGEENKNWKKSKRLIFKSVLFGDDVNRALQKNDGSWSYFANDMAYHYDKVIRKYDKLINI